MGSQSRPLAEYGPDIWGDKFTSNQRDFQLWKTYTEERDELKNEARSMLMSDDGKWTEKLYLINTIERLGVGYHFAEYIEDMLAEMHNTHASTNENCDLFTTALYFRILRQHGYNVSSEIFNKYKDIDGKFSEAITKEPEGLLSLYEAAHLRTHGEAMLDEALVFTTSHLKSIAKSLDSGSLAKQVRRALEQPLHKGIQRIEAKHFILFYEESPSRNDVLLKFAKIDFNLVQMLYKQELSHVNRWWADIDFKSKFPQFRSRVVEGYLWAVANAFEPCYAMTRIMYTKMLCALSVSDDLYDAYGTMEELNIYTKAIERFATDNVATMNDKVRPQEDLYSNITILNEDILRGICYRLDVDSIDGLPEHLKMCYTTSLNVFREFDEELVKQGIYCDVSYLKKAFKANLLAFHKEAVWRDKNYVPPLKEYLMNSTTSSCICMLGLCIILGKGHGDTIGACKWSTKKPKAVVATETMGRIINDIVGYEEEHSRPHVATSIDCYTKEYGVSKEEAVIKLYEMIEDMWKDVNEECLKPTTVAASCITTFLQLMRVNHVTYKDNDRYTHPEGLKHEITFVLVDPIPI